MTIRHAVRWCPVDGNPDKRVAEGWETDQWYEMYRHELGRWSGYFVDDTGNLKVVVPLSLNQPYQRVQRACADHYNRPVGGRDVH